MASHDAINNVRRKINEVLKKEDAKISVGYRPNRYHTDGREEGEVWTDADGREWTKKDGTVQNITKLDRAKTPWFCPVCEKSMSHRLDTKYWRIRGKCMDCVIKEETEMRRNGTWEQYERERVKANYLADIKDKIQELTHLYETVSSPEIIHADNEKILMIEKWNVDIPKIKEDIAKDLEELKELLRKAESGELDDENN